MIKTFTVYPPDKILSATAIDKLKAERQDVPYVVVKFKSGNTSVWERSEKGRCRLVHGGIKQEKEENAVVSSAFNINAKVYYCNKQEAFMICL